MIDMSPSGIRQRVAAASRRVADWLGGPVSATPPGVDPYDQAPLRRWRPRFGRRAHTRTRWFQRDVETAIHLADQGDLSMAAKLSKSVRRDGYCSGLLSTRTSGLVRLPRRFLGDPELVAAIEGQNGRSTLFDLMFPGAELALMVGDRILLGVALGEMVDVAGQPEPVLRRLDPEHLRYDWGADRWYYLSESGEVEITPGDGRWLLWLAGAEQPWNNGLWPALARAYIAKEHAFLHRENYSGKLANPARVAQAPQGATDEQKKGWFEKIAAWGINSVFAATPGYEVKLLESNGRGYEVFEATIATSNTEFAIALAGQIVTTTGGTGFANADIHQAIRADLIQDTADELAGLLNTQGLPAWKNRRYGAGARSRALEVEWDTAPPQQVRQEAESRAKVAESILKSNEALAPYGRRLALLDTAQRYGLQTEPLPKPPPDRVAPANDTAPLAVAASAPVPERSHILAPRRGASAPVLAYTFRPGDPPAEMQLWRAGDNATDYGIHRWTKRSVREAWGEYQRRGNPLPIDIEHNCADSDAIQSRKKTDEPPVTGGYARLELRGGEPWLVFDWSKPAVGMIERRERLAMSPEYTVDKRTGEIIGITRVSLVANPATHNARMLASAGGGCEMDGKIVKDALAALAEGDKDKCAALLQGLIADAASNGDAPAPEATAAMGDDPPAEEDEVATGGEDEERMAAGAKPRKPPPSPTMPTPGASAAARPPRATPTQSDPAPAVDAITAAKTSALDEVRQAQDDFKRDQLLASAKLAQPLHDWAKTQPLDVVESFLAARPEPEAQRNARATQGQRYGAGHRGPIPKGADPITALRPPLHDNPVLAGVQRDMGGRRDDEPVVEVDRFGRLSLSLVRPIAS